MTSYIAVYCIFNYVHCYLRHCLASGEGIVSLGVCLSRCVCVRRISLGGEGNALYPMLSGYVCFLLLWRKLICNTNNVPGCLILFTYLNIILTLLDLEHRYQNATVVALLVVGISSLKIPRALLIRSVTQRNFACTFVLIFAADLPSQIFKLISN